MFHHLIRWGVAALLVVSFAQPARALPLDRAAEDGFTLSFGEVWEHLIGSFVETWEDIYGVPDPIAGDGDSLNNGDSSGTCDPNGGRCR